MFDDKDKKEFERVCEPVIKWLNESCHPHVTVIITPTNAELMEGSISFPCEKFIVD